MIRIKCKDGGWLMLFLCILLSFCGGCSDEHLDETEGMTFRLSLPAGMEVSTRANDTKDLDNITIGDVWVLQYKNEPDDKSFLFAKCFSGTDIGFAQTNQTIEVATSEFSNIASNFYVIVNAGTDYFGTPTPTDNSAYPQTEADLKAKTMDIAAGTTSEPTLLTSGPLNHTSEAGKLVIVAPLQRAFAKVSVQWSKAADGKGTVAVSKVTVKNLPAKMAFYTRGGGALSDTYPPVGEAKAEKVIVDGNFAVNAKSEFFMAENLRGMGTVTSFAEKNLVAKGPGGSLNGCTYLELLGTYTYPGATDAISMKYCIYLGGNLMTDYNIQRGNWYKLTINISGANSADVRVTITDGNVIMFDEVEVIPNTVNFR